MCEVHGEVTSEVVCEKQAQAQATNILRDVSIQSLGFFRHKFVAQLLFATFHLCGLSSSWTPIFGQLFVGLGLAILWHILWPTFWPTFWLTFW